MIYKSREKKERMREFKEWKNRRRRIKKFVDRVKEEFRNIRKLEASDTRGNDSDI